MEQILTEVAQWLLSGNFFETVGLLDLVYVKIVLYGQPSFLRLGL